MTYQQDLVNVLANIHNKANETIALNCSARAIFRIVGNNVLSNIGVECEELDTTKLTDNLLKEYDYLKSHATLSHLLIPDKPKQINKKISFWKRFVSKKAGGKLNEKAGLEKDRGHNRNIFYNFPFFLIRIITCRSSSYHQYCYFVIYILCAWNWI